MIMKSFFFLALLFGLLANQSFSKPIDNHVHSVSPTSENGEAIESKIAPLKNTPGENSGLEEQPSPPSPDAFITTWATTVANESITIPTTGTGYNYQIDWENDGIFDDFNVGGNATHIYATAGTHTIVISGTFPRIYFFQALDKQKIKSVEQWGTGVWSSMGYAFHSCTNLVINASDVPNLTNVTDMSLMFNGATSLNQDISNWNVSTIKKMGSMFGGASSFNQNLNSWDVRNVTTMSGMFGGTAFNKDISGWDVSSVTDMSSMFGGATSFNQAIGAWDVSSVTNMDRMFFDATSFNQDLSTWDVSSVTDMKRMFSDATSFNQDISIWDVSNVTDMQVMFQGATSFNQNIGAWNVSKVTNMLGMFYRTPLSVANYDALLIGWSALTLQNNVGFNVSGLKYCEGEIARQYIIDTYGWTFYSDGKVKTTLSALSLNSGTLFEFDPAVLNYSVSVQGCLENIIVSAAATDGNFVTVSGTGNTLLTSIFPASQDLVITVAANDGCETVYTISLTRGSLETCNYRDDDCSGLADDGIGACENNQFIATWKTTVADETITFPLSAVSGTSMDIDWGDGTAQTGLGNNPTHTYSTAGTYTVSVGGIFDRVWFNDVGSKLNIISIDQWGTTPWSTMVGAFYGCSNLQGLATDTPNLSKVASMHTMFRGSSSFNQDISTWDVGSVTIMQGMFNTATSFNQDLSAWDVGSVTNMVAMFLGATSFNQDLSTWDVSKVGNMNSMFLGASSFNQNLSAWDVSNVGSMSSMFNTASSFNQDLNDWDVSNVGSMSSMFLGASSFNQDLSAWDVSNVTFMTNMFSGVTLSTSNYDALLIGWAPKMKTTISASFSGGLSTYCAGLDARNAIIAKGWTITDGGINGADINLQGNSVNIVSGDTSPSSSDDTDFGTVALNTPTVKTYSIQNTGSTALTVSSIVSTSDDAADFVVGGITLPAILAAGTSSTFTLTFTPTTTGTKTATVTINTNDCDEAAYDFAVSGFGECLILPVAAITNNTGETVLTCDVQSISLTASGGVSYLWDNDLGSEASASITEAGTYTVTVTSANGCTDTESIIITADKTAPVAAITNNTGETVLTCDVQSISVNATGGVSYLWDNDLGSEASASITEAGTYTVTVTSANGCTDTESIIITADKTAPTAGITNNTGETILTNALTSISLTATGGTSYSWSDGVSEVSAVAGLSISTPGTYTVTVYGSNGCFDKSSIVITQYLSTILDAIGLVTDIACYNEKNGAIDITVFGGTPPYSFRWSNRQTTEDISNLSPGTYSVTVKDAARDQKTVSFTISNPPLLTINSTQTNISACALDGKGSITPIATGGTGSYSFSINTGALLTNGIFSDLDAGTYTITVRDENNCTQSQSITITEALPMSFSTALTAVTSCTPNGSIKVSPVGGKTPYSFSKDGGATWQLEDTFNNLSSGNYTVAVKGANGCQASNSTVEITDNGSDAYENNNSLGAAKTISLESTYQARLGISGDADWFKYTNPKSPKSAGTYYLIFDSYAIGQIAELYDENGSLILPQETGLILGTSSIYGAYSLSARESYYIKVSGATSLMCYSIKLSSSIDTNFRISENQSEGTQPKQTQLEQMPPSTIEMGESYNVIAYPNPSNGMFRLALPGFEDGEVRMIIMDGIGRMLQDKIGKVEKAKMIEEVNLTQEAKGVYYVQAMQQGRAKMIRVIIN
jgi:surface protein